MNTTNPTSSGRFAFDEQFLTTDEYEQRFKKSKASQCRARAAGQVHLSLLMEIEFSTRCHLP